MENRYCQTQGKKAPARDATAQQASAYRCFLPDLAGLGGDCSHGSWHGAYISYNNMTHKIKQAAYAINRAYSCLTVPLLLGKIKLRRMPTTVARATPASSN